mmetsp:Transcript_45539/g.120337  ORF Transcript_45539/g.120337 Transcript_45539/m.120337 type:complete len:257 (+) Transcript_45539:745-1515(+)
MDAQLARRNTRPQQLHQWRRQVRRRLGRALDAVAAIVEGLKRWRVGVEGYVQLLEGDAEDPLESLLTRHAPLLLHDAVVRRVELQAVSKKQGALVEFPPISGGRSSGIVLVARDVRRQLQRRHLICERGVAKSECGGAGVQHELLCRERASVAVNRAHTDRQTQTITPRLHCQRDLDAIARQRGLLRCAAASTAKYSTQALKGLLNAIKGPVSVAALQHRSCAHKRNKRQQILHSSGCGRDDALVRKELQTEPYEA